MRATKKLIKGSSILSFEEYGDCEDQHITRLVQGGKLTSSQVYKALHHFGFRWNGVEWFRKYPAWLEKIAGGKL